MRFDRELLDSLVTDGWLRSARHSSASKLVDVEPLEPIGAQQGLAI
jgi:hypothetical protein